jgi:hypothetical protein
MKKQTTREARATRVLEDGVKTCHLWQNMVISMAKL